MLILLPPSEGKTAPSSARPVDLNALWHPELGRARETVATALSQLGADEHACQVLGLGPKSAADAKWNLDLRRGGPASEIYTGVLYQAAGLTGREADVLIFSGLYGAVRPGDVIAPYRLAANTKLPPLGDMSRWWRPHLAQALGAAAAEAGVIVDGRSGPYQKMWQPTGEQLWITIGAKRGGRTITHLAKHYRGLVARALSGDNADLHSPEAVAAAIEARLDLPVSLRQQTTSRYQLDVLVRP